MKLSLSQVCELCLLNYHLCLFAWFTSHFFGNATNTFISIFFWRWKWTGLFMYFAHTYNTGLLHPNQNNKVMHAVKLMLICRNMWLSAFTHLNWSSYEDAFYCIYVGFLVVIFIHLCFLLFLVSGRYMKYSRTLSQSPWWLDDKRIMENSVQELICEPVLEAFKPTGVCSMYVRHLKQWNVQVWTKWRHLCKRVRHRQKRD